MLMDCDTPTATCRTAMLSCYVAQGQAFPVFRLLPRRRQDKGCRVMYAFAGEHFVMTCVTVDYRSRNDAASLLRMTADGEGCVAD